jgi:hypothetical protein
MACWRRIRVRRRSHSDNSRVARQTANTATLDPSPNNHVSTGTPGAARTIPVPAYTCASVAEDQTHYPGVATATGNGPDQTPPPGKINIPSKVTTTLNRDAWVKGLENHPDRDFAEKIINYIDFGVPLLYEGPVLNQTFPNWKSCDLLRTDVKESMLYDISRNWKVGPFKEQPFTDFVGSPMGAFTKPSTSSSGKKTRVIHDLSWPPGHSVNHHIPEHLCSVKYVNIDSAVNIVK